MDQYLGEIRIFAGNFAPRGWALCNGQLLLIAQNTALFSLLGVTYGGDGKTTFALPNLQGRAPLQAGQGAGLSSYPLGQSGGEQSVTLTTGQMPSHNHAVGASTAAGSQASPENGVWAMPGARRGLAAYSANAGSGAELNPSALTVSGGSQPHHNMPPYLALNFIIALEGIYPQRP